MRRRTDPPSDAARPTLGAGRPVEFDDVVRVHLAECNAVETFVEVSLECPLSGNARGINDSKVLDTPGTVRYVTVTALILAALHRVVYGDIVNDVQCEQTDCPPLQRLW